MSYNLNNIVSIKSNKTIYRDENYLIKLYEDNIPVSKILNEAENQQIVLENTDLNIPKLIEVTKMNGKWAIVMEYVDGINLEQYLENHKERVDDVLELLINTQLKILGHRVNNMIRTKEKYTYNISQNQTIDEIKRMDLLLKLNSLKIHSKLCHGDLSLSNIVVKKDGTIWILDWAHAAIGNAETDAARTYLTMLLKDKVMAEKYIKLFSKRSKIELNKIREWIPIVAAGELEKNKNSKSTKNFIDVVEYE